MNTSEPSQRQDKQGSILVIAIIIGRIILECLNVGFVIFRDQGYLGAMIGFMVWGLLLWEFYKGKIWVRYVIAMIHWISLIPALAVLGAYGQSIAAGADGYQVWMMVVIGFSMVYYVIAAILICRSEAVKEFLDKQLNTL